VIEKIIKDLSINDIGGEVTLRVRVHKQDAFAHDCQLSRNVKRERRFSDTALMIDNRKAFCGSALLWLSHDRPSFLPPSRTRPAHGLFSGFAIRQCTYELLSRGTQLFHAFGGWGQIAHVGCVGG
jgi:hypothetical protein